MVRSRKGFTLVELLVVIGIIAVLISILLPSLARARQAALTLQCLSNVRTIGQALMLYADSNKGFYPWGIAQGPDTNGDGISDYDTYWYATLASQLTQASTMNPWDSSLAGGMTYFRCPEVFVTRDFDWTPGSHYNSHPLLMPNIRWGWTYAPLGGQYPPQYKAVWLAKNGSEKAVLWDGTITAPGDPAEASWVGSAKPTAINLDGDMFWWGDGLIDAPGVWATWISSGWMAGQCNLDGVFQDEPNNSSSGKTEQNFRVRHNGGTACNFLFADGHAETRRFTRQGTSLDTGTTDMTHNNFTVPYPVPGLRYVGW